MSQSDINKIRRRHEAYPAKDSVYERDMAALLAKVDELNAKLAQDLVLVSEAVDSLAQENHELQAKVEELEAHLESLQNRYARVTVENDELRKALADAPEPGTQQNHIAYIEWHEHIRKLL